MKLIDKANELGIEVDDKIKMIATARALGIAFIEATFEGGGDEGAIDYVTYYDTNNNEMEAEENSAVTQDEISEFNAEVESFAFDTAYNFSTGDWINNAGGNGTVRIDVSTGGITLDVNYSVNQYDEDVTNALPEALQQSED